MILTEMHRWFRQYAQQMGMQNVRAILPEQIDRFINTSISDFVNDLIRANASITNDRVITDNSKIGNINALRSLYKVKTFKSTDVIPIILYYEQATGSNNVSALINALTHTDIKVRLFINDIDSNIVNGLIADSVATVDALELRIQDIIDNNFNDCSISIDGNIATITVNDGGSTPLKCFKEGDIAKLLFVDEEDEFLCDIPLKYENSVTTNSSIFDLDLEETNSGKFKLLVSDVLYYHDFSINYKKGSGVYKTGDVTQIVGINGAATNLFPIRIIEDQFLADVLQDYVLKPTLRSPIISIHDTTLNNNGDYGKTVIELYLGSLASGISSTIRGTSATNLMTFENGLVPYQIRMSYITKPAKVKYNEDQLSENVNCDLPESTHVDILKHAVDLYRISVQGSLMGAQQQAQRQNQEIARNNARDEGYANPQT